MSRDSQDLQIRVYTMMFEMLSDIVDRLERKREIPADMADDLIYFHDLRNIESADGREVKRSIDAFTKMVDDEIYAKGGDIRQGDCHERDLADAVAYYLERTIRRMNGSRNDYRDRDRNDNWRRGDSYSRRSDTRGRGLVNKERRNPFGDASSSDSGRGNPLRDRDYKSDRDDDRRRNDRGDRDTRRDDRRRENDIRRQEEPVTRKQDEGVKPMDQFARETQQSFEDLEFVEMTDNAKPVVLQPDSLKSKALVLDRALISHTNAGAVFAVNTTLQYPVSSEEEVLSAVDGLTQFLGKYFINVNYRKTQVLHIPQGMMSTIREGIGGKDPGDTAGLYWKEIDEVLDRNLRTFEKKQVESIIVDEFNKRLVTFLRKEANLEWTVTMNHIAQCGDLIALDPIPAEARSDTPFSVWVNGTLSLVLNELFSASTVTGRTAVDKSLLLSADGTCFVDDQTMIQAAVAENKDVWANWLEKYHQTRTVIVRQASMIVTNLGVGANWDKSKFDILGRTQSNKEFWDAYTEETIVDQKMGGLIRQGQKSVYLVNTNDGRRKYRKFDLIWSLMSLNNNIHIVRDGYKQCRANIKTVGTLSVD